MRTNTGQKGSTGGVIQTLLQKAVGAFDDIPVKLSLVSVVSVDRDARTCVTNSIDSQGDNDGTVVNLMVEVDDGVLTLPAIGSTIAILSTDYTLPFAVAYTEIDEIQVIVDDQGYDIKSGLQQINDGSYGGLLQVKPSVKAWNDLQKDVNNLKSIFSTLSATPLVTTAPGSPDAFYTAFVAAMSTYITDILTLTQQGDVENKNVTHGPTL